MSFFNFRKVVDTMKTQKTEYFPVPALRENLRERANLLASRLSRSVARLTSCDMPCPEYGDEVQFQQELTQELFYVQHCRTALERCAAAGGATLRYRRLDGTQVVTRFKKIGPNRVKVLGLEKAG